MHDAASAAAPVAEASGTAEMGNGDDEADVEASDAEHEQGESDAVARKDGESDGGDAGMVLTSVNQAPVDETVPMSEGGLEQAPVTPVTQVTQVTQEDAGDAGDAENSDAPVARRSRRGGRNGKSKLRQWRAQKKERQMTEDTDNETDRDM